MKHVTSLLMLLMRVGITACSDHDCITCPRDDLDDPVAAWCCCKIAHDGLQRACILHVPASYMELFGVGSYQI
jgi:hypothetical protein